MSTSYLITGANRGIGFEIVKLLAQRPGTTIFAGARNPTKSPALQTLASHNPNIHILQLESTSYTDVQSAVETIRKIAGGLDVVIANAGIAQNWHKVLDVTPASVVEHFNVNALGPLILFQAVYPLLLARPTRKFITISSLAGAIGDSMVPVPDVAYGTSKVALNFVTKKIHMEHKEEGIIAFPVHPGTVNTDMGLGAAPVFGMERFDLEPEVSARGVLSVVDQATIGDSGRFWSFDGSELSW